MPALAGFVVLWGCVLLTGVEEMSNWINVKDRLPEREEVVLCWDQSEGEACTGMRVDRNDGWKAEWLTSYWSGTHCSTDYYGRTDITHWMPLPALPGDQEQSK